MRGGRSALVLAAAIASASIAHAQQRPLHPDPYHAHLVEGRVLGPGDAPLAGVILDRVTGPSDDTVYSSAYRQVTDARGAFRYERHGIGVSTGLTWYLAIRRPGCAPVIHAVTLVRRVVPGVGREGDVATGVELRAGACTPAP
jgi:hypothetical protein